MFEESPTFKDVKVEEIDSPDETSNFMKNPQEDSFLFGFDKCDFKVEIKQNP